MLTKNIGTNQTLTSSGVAATTSAISTDYRIVRIATTAAIYLKIGSNPTATSSDMMLPAGAVEKFAITPGHKVSVLQVSAGGTVTVTPVS